MMAGFKMMAYHNALINHAAASNPGIITQNNAALIFFITAGWVTQNHVFIYFGLFAYYNFNFIPLFHTGLFLLLCSARKVRLNSRAARVLLDGRNAGCGKEHKKRHHGVAKSYLSKQNNVNQEKITYQTVNR